LVSTKFKTKANLEEPNWCKSIESNNCVFSNARRCIETSLETNNKVLASAASPLVGKVGSIVSGWRDQSYGWKTRTTLTLTFASFLIPWGLKCRSCCEILANSIHKVH